MWSRIYLVPLLQAEEDRDLVRRIWADKAREKDLLGTDMKVYNSDRWVLLWSRASDTRLHVHIGARKEY